MKKLIKTIINIALSPFILKDYFTFKKLSTKKRFSLKTKDFYPCVKDKTIQTSFDRHYVYHTAWAARVLKETNPVKHVDISSSLFFSATVSAFVPIEFYDYRPADIILSNLESKEGNLMHLPFADNSVNSLSCMHTIEHIGLGRYGDPLDPNGDLKAIQELIRVLAPGGNLLFVTPLGKSAKIEFNAHRIYRYENIIEAFNDLTLKEFSLIPEHATNGGLIRHADKKVLEKEDYACGCFLFTKK